MASLQVTGLSHAFGVTTVLEEINLSVDAGQVVALVGPSGCGKTTLLHLCAGLTDCAEGRINNAFSRPGFMFQQPRLLPWKTTLDNIALGLKARGIRAKERRQRSMDMGLAMGLIADDMPKFPHELSGGMQQRVALARALVLSPDLLLLDEPFSALDIGLKMELYRLLLAQLATSHCGVLMITHDLMEAVRLSDIILVMQAEPGRIVERFTLDTPRDQRDEDFIYQTTARFIQTPAVRHSFEL